MTLNDFLSVIKIKIFITVISVEAKEVVNPVMFSFLPTKGWFFFTLRLSEEQVTTGV